MRPPQISLGPRSAIAGMRFLTGMIPHVRNPVSAVQAQHLLRDRLAQRQETFAAIMRRAVYGHPDSPYARLLRWTGCEQGDLEKLVREEGMEVCLRTLFANGVYLTVDEFKGKKIVRRGSFSMAIKPGELRNPLASFHVLAYSGGSRSEKTPVLIDLEFVRGCAVNTAIFLAARGGENWRKAIWEVCGAGARFRLLKFAAFGAPPVRYFTPLNPLQAGLHPIFSWSERAMRWAGLVAGVPLPRPQHAPVEDPAPILEWLQEVFSEGAEAHLLTMASSAVRLSQAALAAGMDLNGLHFTLGAEPITRRRLEVIHCAGAEALPRYGSMECGPVGYGCLRPSAPDDVHVLQDMHHLSHAGALGPGIGVPTDALFVTSLHPRSPFVLINVSMGDRGRLFEAECGCPLQNGGWRTHLCNIGSFEKLTAGGMTFLDSDVIGVLEELLPDRFGGSATDYQLVEEESDDGRPALKLLIHPRVGALDVAAVREALLESLGSKTIIHKAMELYWREKKMLEVVREAPRLTPSAKILHMHSGNAVVAAGEHGARGQ